VNVQQATAAIAFVECSEVVEEDGTGEIDASAIFRAMTDVLGAPSQVWVIGTGDCDHGPIRGFGADPAVENLFVCFSEFGLHAVTL
jgi:hypothetical protein